MKLTPEHVAQMVLLKDCALATVPLAFALSITAAILALAYRTVDIIMNTPAEGFGTKK